MYQFGNNSNQSFGGMDSGNPLTNAPTQSPKPGFSSWAPDLFGSLSTIGTAFFNSKAGYPTGPGMGYGGGGYDYYPTGTGGNKTMYLVGGAVLLIILLYVFTKKS